jgi:Tol biopolymer transport system component
VIDIRTEIREAFEREQSAFPPAAALRAEVIAAITSHAPATGPGRQRTERDWNWLMVAAAALLAIAIVAGFMAVRLTTSHPTVVRPGPEPQSCLPGTTPPSDNFARVHGCMTYVDGSSSEIVAVDPYHPANRIVLGPSDGRLPIAWSRDGSRLLLMSCQTWCDLDVMNADGSLTRITNGDANGWEGSFSPDGTKVVYDRYEQKAVPGGHVATMGLYMVDVKGGAPRLIANSKLCSVPIEQGGCDQMTGLSSRTYPVWSPDGLRIAYADYRYDLATDEIWTMNADGTDQRRLVDVGKCGANQSAGCTNGLAWSPDGSQLAFHSAGGIYTVRADGSGLRRITKDGVQPSWSPDGSRIAFSRGSELFTMAPNGSNVTQVFGLVVEPPYGWVWNPVSRP